LIGCGAVYTDLLPYLRCPACVQPLALHEATTDIAGETIAGRLCCAGCGAAFPIADGIADMLGPPRPPTIAQAINELPLAAWGYERLWRPFALTLLSGEPFGYGRELPLIARMLAPERGGLFLDVACSNGLYARLIARAGRGAAVVAGVDHARPMLAQARRYARQAGLRISFVRAEAQALPFVSGAAAGVAIGGSLNEIGDLDACLAEARRALRGDGRFAAMSLVRAEHAAGRAIQALLKPGGLAFWSDTELLERFRHHGLRPLEHRRYGVVLFAVCTPDG
jgi:SAM-dependent methyltransferase